MEEQSQQRPQHFEATVRPHFNALYRAALRLTRCHEDAEDLVQEVLLRAVMQLDGVAFMDSPRAWLLRVQYRLFVDGMRRRKRTPVTNAGDVSNAEFAVSERAGPELLAEQSQRYRRLAAVWHELDRKQRALLAMHAEGYSLAELGAITGMTCNAIGVRLHRARARLADLIETESEVEV
jgi:RNA polymerase sigma factor (sigma-70 family)